MLFCRNVCLNLCWKENDGMTCGVLAIRTYLTIPPAESARLLWPINQGALTNNPLLKQTVGY